MRHNSPASTNLLAAHRDQMHLEPGYTLLNAGSYSPLPKPVAEKAAAWRHILAQNPNRFIWRLMPEHLDAAHGALRSFLDVKQGHLLLMPNATFAINIILKSLIKSEMTIVTSDVEYGALARALEVLAQQCGACIVTVKTPRSPESAAEIVTAFQEQSPAQFDLLYFSHISSPTGIILPAKELSAWARSKGARTVIDGAHAPGMIPLALDDVGADFYAGNCHKWMMAPTGSAFLYSAQHCRHLLEPLIISWGAFWEKANADVPSGWGGTFWQRSLEYHGTADRVAQMVIPEAIAFHRNIGFQAMAQRVSQLATHCIERLSHLGLKPLLACERDHSTQLPLRGNMIAFPFRPLRAEPAMGWLGRQHKIEVAFTSLPTGEHFLRVSTAWFSTEEDIDRLAKVLPTLPLGELSL